MELYYRACPICESEGFINILKANYDENCLTSFSFASRKVPEFMHFRMLRCSVCDLLYANPIPSKDIFTKLYKEAAYDSGEESTYAARTYAKLLPVIVERLPDLNGALDIGTGSGDFLKHLLSHGFKNIIGIEPSIAPVAFAEENIKHLIRNTIFSTADFRMGTFSLITCFQTLEHVEHPGKLCRDIYKLLKKGGGVCFALHNYRSLQAKILATKSPIYDIQHLQLNSIKSIRYLLERNGFKYITIRQLVNTYPLRYYIKLLPIGLNIKTKLLKIVKIHCIGDVTLPLLSGNLFALGFK